MTELLRDVPFDQYSRQKQVGIITDYFRNNKSDSFTILDVGGYKGKTSEFLPKDKVTIMDLFDVKASNYVKGSALDMPFEDGAFDFVVNFDVLEHIEKSSREQFLKECSRVAKKAVIIAAPQKTEANEAAEKALNELFKSLHGEDHPWLKEHIAYTIPDFAVIEKAMQQLGWKTTCVPSNDSVMWAIMQGAIFLNSQYPLAAANLLELNEQYNKDFPLDGGNDPAAAYRAILVGSKEENVLAEITKFFADNKVAVTSKDKISQIAAVQTYLSVLIEKTTAQTTDYKKLYEAEAERAEILQKNGLELWERVNAMEAEMAVLNENNRSVVTKLKDKIKNRHS